VDLIKCSTAEKEFLQFLGKKTRWEIYLHQKKRQQKKTREKEREERQGVKGTVGQGGNGDPSKASRGQRVRKPGCFLFQQRLSKNKKSEGKNAESKRFPSEIPMRGDGNGLITTSQNGKGQKTPWQSPWSNQSRALGGGDCIIKYKKSNCQR